MGGEKATARDGKVWGSCTLVLHNWVAVKELKLSYHDGYI